MYDFIVVGGGIAGIASAELLQRSGRSVLLIEAEEQLGTKSSSEMHGWFHTGALYAALPDRSFFKTLVGNIDDLVNYYQNFPEMNLEVSNHLRTRSLDGWFSNNLNLYSYVSPLDPQVRLGMKVPWSLAIINARRQLEGFDKIVTTQELSTQVMNYKGPKTKSTIYEDELNLNLGRISKTFITRDRTMNAYAIMKSLVTSLLSNGGHVRTSVRVQRIDGNDVHTNAGVFRAKTIINASGASNEKAVSVYLSPLAVVYPALSDLNFIKMTPNVKDTFNHLTHSCEDFQYSVIGNGIYIKNDEAEKAKIKSLIREKIRAVFNVNPDDYQVEIYYGTKTEVTTKSQLRNYQYHIIKEGNQVSIFPGKFTLSFSLAVNLCRRLGIDPVSANPKGFDPECAVIAKSLISRSKHYLIAREQFLSRAKGSA